MATVLQQGKAGKKIRHLNQEGNPAFSVHNNDVAQTCNNDATTTINFSTKLYDYGNNFNVTDKKFYAPCPGVYSFTAAINLTTGIDHTATQYLFSLSVSTKDHYLQYDPVQFDSSPSFWTLHIAAQQHLDTGDFAKITFYQTGGSTVTVHGGGGTYFTGALIA